MFRVSRQLRGWMEWKQSEMTNGLGRWMDGVNVSWVTKVSLLGFLNVIDGRFKVRSSWKYLSLNCVIDTTLREVCALVWHWKLLSICFVSDSWGRLLNCIQLPNFTLQTFIVDHQTTRTFSTSKTRLDYHQTPSQYQSDCLQGQPIHQSLPQPNTFPSINWPRLIIISNSSNLSRSEWEKLFFLFIFSFSSLDNFRAKFFFCS